MAELGRRAWLKRLLPKAANVVAEEVEQRLEQHFPAQLRPPGAVGEALFMSLCSRCNKCVDACDEHAAVFLFTEEAGVYENTPVMRPELRACHMCEGFPCAAACETGALVVPKTPTWDLGTVAIDKTRCITFSGPECGACVDICPGDVNAMTLQRWKPVLDSEQCIGCGICVDACPMMPAAIGMVD